MTEKDSSKMAYIPNATMMIVHNPTCCVGCRRCEVSCTEYNDGKTQPALARIKISRNYNFGPRGVQAGFWNAEGIWGNHRFIGDTCLQCPYPVPCMVACPCGAIEVVPPSNFRMVNVDKCDVEKCSLNCLRACPWEMTTFDEETKKVSICHLCDGDPQCVKACTTGALSYVAWTDRTKDVPARLITAAVECLPK